MNSSELPSFLAQVGRHPMGSATPPRSSVAIGFGSPAGDTGVTRLDLNDILVRNALATYLMRVSGSSMSEAGIDDDDLVLVDRAVTPVHGHVVVAVVDGEFYCRRLYKQAAEIRLQAATSAVSDLVPSEGQEFNVWGVVTHVIKAMPV